VDRRVFIASAIAAGPLASGFAEATPTRRDGYLRFDADVPGLKAKIFAKDILHRDTSYPGYQTFNETGDEFYFAVTDKDWQSSRIRRVCANAPDKIETLLLVNDKWEGEPCITLDGKRLFFTAIMPPGDKPWHSDLYFCDKTSAGWSAPKLLPAPVNSPTSEWHASLTEQGVLYFASERDGARLRADLYRAEPVNGAYPKVEKLPSAINTEYNDCDPLIAPDESYLIFHSNRPGGYGEHDLYISFRDRHGQWSAPKNMGPDINSAGWEMAPSLTPDGRYLFFTRRKAFQTDQPSQILWVSAAIVETLR
jgi:Tol biopolymer transport system component